MSTTNDNAAQLPGYSASASPPPYQESDAHSVVSSKSTSKSILNKLFNRNPSGSSSSRPNEIQRKVDEKEARYAARAAYFAMQ